jgi:hypothetical protein
MVCTMAIGECEPVTPGISRKTYDGLSSDAKLSALLDFAVAHELCLRNIKSTLDKRRKIDIRISAGSGSISAAAILFFKWLFFR